ncbi:MAG TPA: dienelactone hydrolase family protein [Methylomirabilota bacterium]
MLRRHRMRALFLAAVVLGGCAGGTSTGSLETTTPAGTRENIPIAVAKPDGPGPFPAVVIMHDCSGLGTTSSGAPGRWSRELVTHGYVVIIPDSFSTRGFPDGVCTSVARPGIDVSPGRRAHDAYAALTHARALPYVDGKRVGIMGGSHGGSSTLAAMVAPDSEREPLARERRAGFAAGVALYPRCAARLGTWRGTGVYKPIAPLLILIGEKDDWTPAGDCQRLAEASRQAALPVTIKVYPGAHHSFDSPNPIRYVATRIKPSTPSGRGATTGGNAEAWSDSIRTVIAFFGEHLR